VQDSLWFTTRSALFQGGDAAWQAVAAYAAPLDRLVARRWPWVRTADREDLVHDLLVEVHQSIAPRHDAGRGKFRALLQTVVARRVVDLVRRKAPAALDAATEASLVAPARDELEALDVEAALLDAMAACRDRFTQGRDADPDVLYALADRVVHGLAVNEIARKGGVSVDRVNRLLRRGRDEVFCQLLARELELPPDDPRLPSALEVFQRTLRRPGDAAALLEEHVQEPPLRGQLEELLGRFRAGVARFAETAGKGGELGRGLALVLEGP